MTLENRLLQKLAEEPAAARRHELQFGDAASGWTLYLTADRRDDLSCLVWELTLRRHSPMADLTGWTQAVAARTQGAEGLQVYEVDLLQEQALLRAAPQSRGGHKLYLEAHLQSTGTLTLRRYQVPTQGGSRRQVAFPMTNEALARLVAQLAVA